MRTLLNQRQKDWLTRRRKAVRRPPPAAPPPPAERPQLGARAAPQAAQGAQHAGRAAQPPHEEAARDDPQRAARALRRPARRRWRASSSSRSASPTLRSWRIATGPRPAGRLRTPVRPDAVRRGRACCGRLDHVGELRLGTRERGWPGSRPPGTTRRGGQPRSGVPALGVEWFRRSAARLDVHLHLAELVRVRLGVVPAEQQLAALGEYGTDLRSRAATVAAVGGGQLGPGQGSWLHSGLPPSRRRTGVRHR